VTRAHGIVLSGTQFWIIHRRVEYGPFDYEWNKDFCGIEMIYQEYKFGEYCSPHEFFADTEPLQLPLTVREVASIVFASLLQGLQQGLGVADRVKILKGHLNQYGLDQFELTAQQD